MKTIKKLTNNKRVVKIIDNDGYYTAVKFVNIEDCTGSKTFKSLKGAEKFANNFLFN